MVKGALKLHTRLHRMSMDNVRIAARVQYSISSAERCLCTAALKQLCTSTSAAVVPSIL
jgi:hypothetical protein